MVTLEIKSEIKEAVQSVKKLSCLNKKNISGVARDFNTDISIVIHDSDTNKYYLATFKHDGKVINNGAMEVLKSIYES